MIHIILVVAIVVLTLILALLAFAGIKFYRLNSGVEKADSDSSKLKTVVVVLTVLISSAATALLFI